MLENIKSVIICLADDTQITVDKNYFSNFYIANINASSDEVPYEKTEFKNVLFANFFMIKINKKIDMIFKCDISGKFNNNATITEVKILFKNNKYLSFYLASTADPFAQVYNNQYEKTYITESDICLLISKYNIKYKDYLFS